MILKSMLERLYAGLVSGPAMNARPHSSRQRVDVMELEAFQSLPPATLLKELLLKQKLEIPARVPAFTAPDYPEAEWSDQQKKDKSAFARQRRLLDKLHGIAEDAHDYFNDHGESCLALGFPLLSLPTGSDSGLGRARDGARLLAPVLLMPLALTVRRSSRMGVTLGCEESGADLIRPNSALVAWLERQTGQNLGEVFADDEGADPWREITEVLQRVATLAAMSGVEFSQETLLQPVPPTDKIPKQAALLPSAVLGLFPLSNQALLRDTRWMMDNEPSLARPVSAFLKSEALAPAPPEVVPDPEVEETSTTAPSDSKASPVNDSSDAWLVTHADPCQSGAVQEARRAETLVVHGPPGTGKSQTITNIIGDHLARGERVLFVCDKRTALDVVKYRLDALGLGKFCGVVHDPTADRKDFYMGLREQLENLNDAPLPLDPTMELSTSAAQAKRLREDLEVFRKALHTAPDGGGTSFHEMLGEWLELTADGVAPFIPDSPGLRLETLDPQRAAVEEILRRSAKVGWSAHPWRDNLRISVSDLLAQSSSTWTAALENACAAAHEADAARVEAAAPQPEYSLTVQATLRRKAAELLGILAGSQSHRVLAKISQLKPNQVAEIGASKDQLEALMAQVQAKSLDRQCLIVLRSSGLPLLVETSQRLVGIVEWREWKSPWYGFLAPMLAGKCKQAATAAMAAVGLVGNTKIVEAEEFYTGLKNRLTLVEMLRDLAGIEPEKPLPDDAELADAVTCLGAGAELMRLVAQPEGANLATLLREALNHPSTLPDTIAALNAAAAWAEKLAVLLEKLKATRLPSDEGLARWCALWIAGTSAEATVQALLKSEPQLEDVARLRDSLAALPEALRPAVESAALHGAGMTEAWKELRAVALRNELQQRLHAEPSLTGMDGDRVEAAFETLQHLAQRKTQLVRDHVHRLWLNHQKSRLLASTGTQLNKHGSALRQRLYVRGKKALKLRQMLATGAEIEGGDPLFDLCPVWMASPATVAQIFPRTAVFDTIIFDEASQCRLEEALPVLLRGLRVVVAGDPKQLPPTRFFESGLAESEDTDAESADELFLQQQSEAEDLLTAALNLDVHQAYLDVHYRSRNEDLIGFSNQTYYGSRLQPIPGHPKNKALNAPITLHRVDGVYAERANVAEAKAVAALVAELLDDSAPPSIGIACFNLPQRDAIHDALGELAEQDPTFAGRLSEARDRRGASSYEGLFVKNLENVQGDERDVMIISTTFGLDDKGKFRRNFGALSQREGGRRLNVLITRARTAIHLMTSIPVAEYRQSAEAAGPSNGRLQLYGYLRYAEDLARAYTAYHDRLEAMQPDENAECLVRDSVTPSRLAQAIGQRFKGRCHTGTQIHWGNDGFCVDVACVHPVLPADVTIGVMTDFARFHKTPDPLAWDIFRTQVLKSQGWDLHRVWSPTLFRRAEETVQRLYEMHRAKVAEGHSPEMSEMTQE